MNGESVSPTNQIRDASGPAIRLRDVDVAYSRQLAIESINVTFEPGEFVSIVGPSGCGKSTLLRVIAGLQAVSKGQMEIGNVDGSAPTRGRVGFVFQQPTLLPWRNVTGNIALPLELQGVAIDDQAIRNVCELVGLADTDGEKLPRMLSGGMRMRVSLARTLVTDPEVMLLDEPLAAVDDILRNQLLVEISELWRRHRWTTILVTHNVAEAVFVSQRVLVMSSQPGRIAEEIKVGLDFPRTDKLRSTSEFATMTGKVSTALREASQ